MGPKNIADFLRFAAQHPFTVHQPDAALLAQWVQRPFQAASVLVLVTMRAGGAHVVLTVRPAHLRVHSGQIAFPGGRMDVADADAASTALRETEEELGLPRSKVAVLGQLPLCRTLTGFDITPILGYADHLSALQPNPAEVAEVFYVPMAHVLDRAAYQTRPIEYGGHRFDSMALPYQGYDIWGATAHILYSLAQVFAAYPQR